MSGAYNATHILISEQTYRGLLSYEHVHSHLTPLGYVCDAASCDESPGQDASEALHECMRSDSRCLSIQQLPKYSDTIRGWFTRLIEELTASVDATTLNGRRERRAVCVPITRLDSGLSVTALAEAIGS